MSEELLSNCCGATKHGDLDLCSECLEHADFEAPEKRGIQNMDGTVEYFTGEY
jgi:hypothetical protein